MRTIKLTKKFERDYKREKRAQHGKTLDSDLSRVLKLLVTDAKLHVQIRYHSLFVNWKDCRYCHIKLDLVLVYKRINDNILELLRLGSHSNLGF